MLLGEAILGIGLSFDQLRLIAILFGLGGGWLAWRETERQIASVGEGSDPKWLVLASQWFTILFASGFCFFGTWVASFILHLIVVG